MSKEQDPFRKYVDDLKNRKWRCKFCNKEFAGSTPRIRWHLAGIPGHNIRACEKVDDTVRAEALRAIEGRDSVLDTSTVGTSGEGTEGTVVGTTQSVLPSVDASNRLRCAPQQTSFDLPTGTGTAPACPQVQEPLHPSMPQDLIDRLASPSFDISALFEFFEQSSHGDVLPTPLLSNITTNSIPLNSNEQYPGFDERFADASTPDAPPCPTDNRYILENFLKSCEEEANASEQSVLPSDDASNPTDTQNLNQLGCAPQQQSFYPLTGTGTAPGRPQGQGSLPYGDMPVDNLDNTQQSSHGDVLPTSLLSNITTNSIPLNSNEQYPGFDERFADASTPDAPPYSDRSILPDLLPENLREPLAKFFEDIEADERRNPEEVDGANPSQDCGQPRGVEEVPVPSNRSPTNIVQQSGQLPPRCDEEDGNDIRRFPSTAQMEIDPSSASLHTSDSHILEATIADSLVVEASTDTVVPSSSHKLDTNRGAPMTSHPNTSNHFEETGALKRKLGDVNKLLEHVMVGEAFQKNTTKILEYLGGNQISRLGICGMGGVGKTTIMLHIHNRLLEEANYGDVLWITVSQDFKTRKLQDTIWEALGLDKLQEKDVRKRAAMLCDHLTKKGKFTIILDNVWKCIDLTEVGIPVKVEDGMKLVLTTRFFDICHQMQCQMIKIEPLPDIEAKSLFLEKLQSEVALNLETEAVVMSVIKECAGLPLAIITIARSMRGVTNVFQWKDCLEKLKESDMGQTDMEKVLKKLKFSYNRLSDHEYQQCFLSCALYPEDQLIDKFEMIEFFIDQGLIGRLNTREKQYDRGLTILQKLVNACLLEDHEGKMKMHDLIRDMAWHIMSVTSIVKAGKGLRRIPSEEYWTDALEKVSLMENDIEEFPLNMSPNCPKLSTFLLNTSLFCDLVIPDSFFKHLWGLKVLNLSGCRLRELPDSISDLVNLTALLLRECLELHRIPHLGKLRSLRKLDIFSCVWVEALEGLEMLVNLKYLDIAYTCIERLPKGTLGALLNLQCLGAGLVNGEEITKLWALETLICFFDNVDDFNKFVRLVSKRTNNPLLYNICVHQELFRAFEPTPVGLLLLDCERSVNIVMRSHAIVSARGESSGSGSGICILIPHDVQNLTVCNCDGVTNLSNMGQLENLEVLRIRCWNNLRVLCGAQGEELIDIHDSPTRTPTALLFRSLRDLKISDCPKLKYLFGHEPKFSLPHLQRIEILRCVEMVGITMAATSPPPYPPPAFPSLEEIMVSRCDKMKRVVEFEWLPHFPNLRTLSVFYSDNMEEIIGGLSSYMSVEEISSDWLLVEGCHELPLHLRNLQTIQVIGYEGMAERISGVGQGQEGSMTTPVNNTPSSSQSSISLPKLNFLWLCMLPQLKSIYEVPITCSSKAYLSMVGCPKLKRIPLELQLCHIEDLPYIKMEGEKNGRH